MAKNPRIFESNCFENWYLYNNSFRKGRGNFLLSESPSYNEFTWQFRPYAKRYQSALNPIFLVEIPHLQAFESYAIWLIRDGLIPLLWFFKNYPKPLGGVHTILVHEDLVHAVPLAWMKQTGTYRTVSYNQEQAVRPAAEPSRILFTGLVLESACALDSLKTRFKNIIENFGEARFAKLEKLIAFSIRPDTFLPDDQSHFQLKYLAEVFSRVGREFKILNLDDLKLISDLSDTYVHDFNENVIVADGFLDHMLLSKGARLLGANGKLKGLGALSKDEHFISLSPFHGMVVKMQADPVDAKLRPKLDAEIEKIMMSEANQYYPWPRWIVEWVQEQQSNRSSSKPAKHLKQ